MSASSVGSSTAPPVGLLSPANADLYRRFEAEETKTNHLRQKEKQQSAALAQLTARIDDINQSLSNEEVQCNQRTVQIKEELDALDREEAALDVQIKHRKKQLQAMTLSVADIKIQLAYNFTSIPKGQRPSRNQTSSSKSGVVEGDFNVAQFAETLSEEEIADIVGESYYIDEATGTRHRVIFTDPADKEEAGGGPNAASPARTPSSKARSDGHKSSRSRKDGGSRTSNTVSQGSWLSTTVAKRATYLLLENARSMASAHLADVEHTNTAGGYAIDADYFRDRTTAQQQLTNIQRAIRSLLLTTPTANTLLARPTPQPSIVRRSSGQGSKLSPTGGQTAVDKEDDSAAALISAVLPVKPASTEAFDRTFHQQREQLEALRFTLRQEEQLMDARKAMTPSAWIAAATKLDMDAFEGQRTTTTPSHSDAPPSSHSSFLVDQRAARLAPASGVETVHHRPLLDRSDATPRPTSAPSMSRFAAAASRQLRSIGAHNNEAYEGRFLQAPASSQLAPRPPTEYRFRSHVGLQRAVEYRSTVRRHHQQDTDDGSINHSNR